MFRRKFGNMIYCIENVFTVYSTDRVLVSKLIYLLGLVNIFRMPEWSHMRDYIFIKAVEKDLSQK